MPNNGREEQLGVSNSSKRQNKYRNPKSQNQPTLTLSRGATTTECNGVNLSEEMCEFEFTSTSKRQ